MKTENLRALHSSSTPEHGTPPDMCLAARAVLGRIDLDPASTKGFNEAVEAARFYTRADNSLSRPWAGRVFCNPPSGKKGALVKAFWSKLTSEYRQGNVRAAIWIGFSIDQLQTLQNTDWAGPLSFPICVPSRRIRFMRPDRDAGRTNSPTKPNFVCLMPDGEEMTARFKAVFEKHGEVKL